MTNSYLPIQMRVCHGGLTAVVVAYRKDIPGMTALRETQPFMKQFLS
jgi:hypothetical protein